MRTPILFVLLLSLSFEASAGRWHDWFKNYQAKWNRQQDTTKPTIALQYPTVVEAKSRRGAIVNFSATASDNIDGNVDTLCSPQSGKGFPVGVTAVNCSASDKAGNIATARFEINVVDSTPPELLLLNALTATSSDGQSRIIEFGVSAWDTVDTAVDIQCQPASGDVFAIGDTRVDCVATDDHQNTASGHFVVTVNDSSLPLEEPSPPLEEPSPPAQEPPAPEPQLANVVVNWTIPTQRIDGSALHFRDIHSYQIYFQNEQASDDANSIAIPPTDAFGNTVTDYTLTDLHQGQYLVSIASVDAEGNVSQFSSPIRLNID